MERCNTIATATPSMLTRLFTPAIQRQSFIQPCTIHYTNRTSLSSVVCWCADKMWITALALTLITICCSAEDTQLKLIGKWTAVNAEPSEQVAVICESTGPTPTWHLSEVQKSNPRIQVVENGTKATLRILPNLQPGDEGQFSCGYSKSNLTGSLQFNLKLYDPANDPAIRVTVAQEMIAMHGPQDAQWLVYVESGSNFSIEPDFFISDKPKIECKLEKSIKYQCVIRVRNATEADMEHYEFVAYNDRSKKSFKLILLVFPEIGYEILATIPPVYTTGLVTSPICMPDGAVAIDTGTLIRKHGVRWHYTECEDLDNCTNGEARPIESISNGTAEEDQGALTYTLKNFSPKKSGILKCVGVNSKGFKVEATKKVCVTDGPIVLTKNTTGPLDMGKKATLFCEFSKCNYDSSAGIRWFYTQNIGKKLSELGDLEEIAESVKSGELGGVFRSRLNVDSLLEGTYVCKAKAIGNYPEHGHFPVLSAKTAAR